MKPDEPDISKRYDCGCIIERYSDDSHYIRFCPLHAAAPELLAACQGWLDWLGGSADISPLEDRTRAAIAAARKLFPCPECGIMVNTPHPQ